ncbi:MAG: dienelactone hydrolase family protein [Hyphomonadaceae bacterium]|nr:dienelactone hydrolase family protein [Hyphomonadaceae bacterium]
MCDEQTIADDERFLANAPPVSRRAFGALSAAASIAACTTGSEAQGLTEADVTITTPDGDCDAFFVHPASGKHPGVIVWPDIMGLRPAFRTMGRRLAAAGYAVLTVNPFYRVQRSPILAEGESFSDPPIRQKLLGLAGALTRETTGGDTLAFIRFLDNQRAVDASKKIGATGYCMGGKMVLWTAATAPDRVGAGASFHGGGLATNTPASPHLLIPEMKASFLIAIAQNDDQSEPDAKNMLRAAFDAAHLSAEIEVYPAQHGWCAIDSRVYDEAQAERAWSRLLALFSTALA